MINIIAHRGFWTLREDQNTEKSFELALSNGFGIETDLRDYNQNVVISHDIPDGSCISLERFLSICSHYPEQTLALNIKSDGLQDLIYKSKIASPHFFFDMSNPDMLGYKRSGLIFYTRYSDIELMPSLYNDADGVWLDNFDNNVLNVDMMSKFLNDKKNVVLVSPELHKMDKSGYWHDLKEYMSLHPNLINKIGICTDFPLEAREYFNE